MMKLKLEGTTTDEILAANGLSLYEEYERAVETASIPQGATVFDAATGSGRMTGILLKRGYRVISGDIDKEKLDELKTNSTFSNRSNLELAHLDLEHLAYENSYFDHIVCANAVHELKNPIAVLNELKRVYSGAGVFVLIDFMEEGFDIIEQIVRFRKGTYHAHGTLSRKEVEDFLKKHFLNVTGIDMRLNWAYIARTKS
ncbi:MAG: class I SAM-dependent methyltransferase [Deltaproteobacteria bacterium]|nr:class I SAM-dependent methyltransferase [Deltaproteobacteria bacterium]